MEIESGRDLFGPGESSAFSLLPYLEPGLFLDVGAAAGHNTHSMLRRSPDSRVKAFEPFPGNLPFFLETIGDDGRVELFPNAVSNVTGTHDFHVGSTVAGSEAGWEKMTGYSSVGKLVEGTRPESGEIIQVDTVRIDDVIGEDAVRFMKIDVQGGELSVLQSAQQAMAEGRIDMMLLEYSGDQGIVDFLGRYAPRIYDSDYLLVPTPKRRWYGLKRLAELRNWSVIDEARLSTGRTAFNAWPLQLPKAPDEYAKFLRSENQRIGYVQTDLLVVCGHFREAFELARAKLLGK